MKEMKPCNFKGCSEYEHYHLPEKQLNAPYCCLCGEDDLIMSGVDAFVYGVPTEKFCFDCARVIHDQIIAPMRDFYSENYQPILIKTGEEKA